MDPVKSPEQISLVLGYLVPGLIIIYVRAQFLTGRVAPHKDLLLTYFTLSIIYLALMDAGLVILSGTSVPLHEQTRYWLPILLFGAFIFGGLIGLNAATGTTRRWLRRIKVYLPHAFDSAWDWKFSRFPESLVMLTLKDGSRVAGWCDAHSFMGSDPKDRDIYISQVYEVDAAGNWHLKTVGKSIYIAANEVRTIEFVPTPKGDST